MKKLATLILALSLTVAMSGTVLGAVQFVEGFNVSCAVNSHANYDVAGYAFGLKYIPTVSYNLKKVELMAGEGTGSFTVQLRPNSGGWPSNTVYRSVAFSMVNTVSWQGAEFSSSYPVVAGTTYWIVFKPVPGSQASICMGSATPITAAYDDPKNGAGWDGYLINPYNGLPFPWMAKFYKDTGGAGYDVTIWAWIQNEGWMDWVPITMDGAPTGKTTPYTFTGLTGTHTFAVPSTDVSGHAFYEWSTGWTGTTLTVSSGGTYTARYRDSATASLTVTSPNGGESWKPGTTHAITWTSTGSVGANVKIELLKSGAVKGTITTANDGSYSWTIGSSHSGTDYKIRITSSSNPAITDSSDNYFTITADGGTGKLTVTSPNGGESWKRGTTHAITWTSTGSVGANVKIELLKSGAVKGTITTANDGSYSWTIGSSHSGTDYKIRITSSSNPAITDSSDNNFAITT